MLRLAAAAASLRAESLAAELANEANYHRPTITTVNITARRARGTRSKQSPGGGGQLIIMIIEFNKDHRALAGQFLLIPWFKLLSLFGSPRLLPARLATDSIVSLAEHFRLAAASASSSVRPSIWRHRTKWNNRERPQSSYEQQQQQQQSLSLFIRRRPSAAAAALLLLLLYRRLA